jgi:hypothetical protein
LEVVKDFLAATGAITFTGHFTTTVNSFFVTRRLRCICHARPLAWEHGGLTNLRTALLLEAFSKGFYHTRGFRGTTAARQGATAASAAFCSTLHRATLAPAGCLKAL